MCGGGLDPLSDWPHLSLITMVNASRYHCGQVFPELLINLPPGSPIEIYVGEGGGERGRGSKEMGERLERGGSRAEVE